MYKIHRANTKILEKTGVKSEEKKAVSDRMETVVLTARATVTAREENHLPVNRTNSPAWWRLHGPAVHVTSPPGSKLKR